MRPCYMRYANWGAASVSRAVLILLIMMSKITYRNE